MRTLAAVVAAVAIVGGLACAGSPRQRPIKMGDVDTGPNTLTAARKYLEGRWSLLSFEVFPPGGSPVSLTGSGSLVYDDFGNLQMEIRVDEATSALLGKAGIPVRDGIISSSGRVVVDMAGRTLTYVMEGQPPAGAPSGPLAANRPRHWQVDNDVLTLTTKDDSGNPLSVGKWKKVQ